MIAPAEIDDPTPNSAPEVCKRCTGRTQYLHTHRARPRAHFNANYGKDAAADGIRSIV
jgi:hypothetical protein